MRACTACHRPVKHHEAACPFCAQALTPGPDLGAAARFAIGSAIIAAAGCTTPPQPVYGAPASPLPSASASSTPSPIPPYGAMPPPIPPSSSPTP